MMGTALPGTVVTGTVVLALIITVIDWAAVLVVIMTGTVIETIGESVGTVGLMNPMAVLSTVTT